MAEMVHINWQLLVQQIRNGSVKALSRTISYIENEVPGYEKLLSSLMYNEHTKVIGITGPPGAGKSTLVDALIEKLVQKKHKVAVLCVDPSSPINMGALLGDRIRMSEWYNHPDVFIRSLATRGSLGGLHPKIIEITDILKEAWFDYIIVETVGVGQSEVEIAGLADTTIVVLVPEGGDEIQTMKAGLMEIADIFVVNKSDRPGADDFIRNLKMIMPSAGRDAASIPVVRTVASEKNGMSDLLSALRTEKEKQAENGNKSMLLVERAYHLLQNRRMKNIKKTELKTLIERQLKSGGFNLYSFVEQLSGL